MEDQSCKYKFGTLMKYHGGKILQRGIFFSCTFILLRIKYYITQFHFLWKPYFILIRKNITCLILINSLTSQIKKILFSGINVSKNFVFLKCFD